MYHFQKDSGQLNSTMYHIRTECEIPLIRHSFEKCHNESESIRDEGVAILILEKKQPQEVAFLMKSDL